jgi:hypothetical protein
MRDAAETTWLRCGELPDGALRELFARFGLEVHEVAPGAPIPGTYWGEPEAGIVGPNLYVRADTPVHSALHEGCHLVCADGERRAKVDADIGGDYDEENGVCYLQLLLATLLDGAGRALIAADMDAWGYTFRLGSTAAWFEGDAEDARQWLCTAGLLDAAGAPTWSLRP